MSCRPARTHDAAYQEYHHNSQGKRVNTDSVIVETLRKQYPNLYLAIAPLYNCDLLGYTSSGQAQAEPFKAEDVASETLKWRCYTPPARRMDGLPGFLYDQIKFGKYIYTWKDQDYILYIVNDGKATYEIDMSYLLGSTKESAEALLLAAGEYSSKLHEQVFVYDGGYWQKSHAMWDSVQDSRWENVILDPDMKKSLIAVVDTFFSSREKYSKLKVPWKRGIIYYGPPGNGKTISIKAMMHMLSERPDPIPTLYVRSLASYMGPLGAIMEIFAKARETAPCFLVWEDLDSIITDSVRSYFLNEVDGLKSNDGILMLGSTNHLDRLDPGLAKRPSRFDRKYFFPNPNLEERVRYCEFWRAKLAGNDSVEFPEKICPAVAAITADFSFAYIQEAFVAALLAIAGEEDGDHKGEGHYHKEHDINREGTDLGSQDISEDDMILIRHDTDDDLEQYALWRQLKVQIRILRDEISNAD